jgi:hypothetical protein
MAWRVEEDEPLPRVAMAGRKRQIGTEGVMIDECPLDTLKVEDHPQMEGWEMKDRRSAPQLVVGEIGVAAHGVGEKINHVP